MIVNKTLNKVISSSPALQETLLDLTADTVAPGNLAKNETAHDKEGDRITGRFLTEDAEAWAVGRRNGVPVDEGDVTYHNNSKWYSEVSEAASVVSGSCMRIAGGYADAAEDSAIISGSSMRIAGQYAVSAEENAVISGSAMRIAVQSAEDSEAWAVGQRDGVDVPSTDPTYQNNSEYWARYSQQYAVGALHYKGAVLFANIPTTGIRAGDVYDIKDAFTTDSRFQDGAGISCDAGTNIIWNENNKWDIDVQGGGGSGGHTIVDEEGAELTQRSKLQFESRTVTDDSNNDTTIVDGDSKDDTITFTSSDNDATTEKTSDGFTSVATMASGESHASLFQKISKMFLNIRKLWNTVGSTALDTDLGLTVTAQLASIKACNTYSTSETWTGEYDTDGKKIYKVTFIVNNPTVGSYFNINGNVDFSNCNLKSIRGILTGIAGNEVLEWKIPYYFASNEYVNIFRSNENIKIQIVNAYTISKAEVTVKYTKTTD